MEIGGLRVSYDSAIDNLVIITSSMKESLSKDGVLREKCFSFDIFDTVLTRAVCPPEAVFVYAAEEGRSFLPPNCSPAQFARYRQHADGRAKTWYGHGKTFEHIYHELADSLNLSAEATEGLMAAELAVERRVLYPVPSMQAAIASVRARGGEIVFTSDMYLPADFLKERLVEHGLWGEGDRVFVSCEYGVQKSGGRLFQPMLQAVQHTPGQTVHIGNCAYADVKGARWAGIRGVHFDAGNPNRYEQILGRFAPDSDGVTSAMAGASRYARLHVEATSPRDRALRDVAAGVMAPVLAGFVLWILRQAHERQLDRLYFTSRDGHALIPIAQRLADALTIDCEFRYLYLSRAALTAANPDAERLNNTLEFELGGGEEVLSRFNLSMEDILPHLPSPEAKKQVQGRPLTEQGKRLLASAIAQYADNGEHAANPIRTSRELLRRYLKREGLHESGAFGFVDIGWKGSVHSLLTDFLQQEDIRSDPLLGFLFGMSTPQQPGVVHRTAYFFDEHRKRGFRNVLQPGSAIYTIMEVFCTADHGTVTGFREANGQIEPVTEAFWPDRITRWGLPVVRRSLDAFLEGLTVYDQALSRHAEIRPASAELLRSFWQEPTAIEAEAWGSFPQEIGRGEGSTVDALAPRYDWSAIPQFAQHGSHAPQHILHRFSWPQGSLARSSSAIQAGIDLSLRVRGRIKRIARKIIYRIPN